MNRTTFLFLALLIASCIVTVNSRHEARSLITQKTALTDKVTSLQEAIRRLELDNARFSAKTCPLPSEAAPGSGARTLSAKPAPSAAAVPAAIMPPGAAAASKAEPAASTVRHDVPKAASTQVTAVPTSAIKAAPAKQMVTRDEDALTRMMDKAAKR